ncbi:MAG: ribonuclease H-like domain-containing protein, partial [Phycisphaeraceae bacterium]|nr:ribonuclease H-like domain-containing protein [Phycisphaeraceae bacterium]
MLRRSFCHIPGVGLGYERKLWSQGCLSWQDALSDSLQGKRASSIAHFARLAQQHYENRNARYFAQNLPPREHWRLYNTFGDSRGTPGGTSGGTPGGTSGGVAYLDIETTGLGYPTDHVTTIALYDGRRVRTYVHGQNLDDFAHDVERYDLLVTYNGKSFDLPFLRKTLHLTLDHAHIDLMHPLRHLGYRGGLKGIERQLGFSRPGMEDLDGYAAVLLWQRYRREG